MSGIARCAGAYTKFRCIGSDCEDSCCIGWQVDLDRETYQNYRQNTLSTLTQRFKASVKRNHAGKDDQHFGVITMQADGRCPFLDQENLCKIQRQLGPQALSPTCSSYPRRVNRFGLRLEYSLALSCPEAARLMLLDQEPISLIDIPADPGLPGYAASLSGGTAPPNREALRAMILGMLQCRALDLDLRLILLGLLLESIASLPSGDAGIPDLLTRYGHLIERPSAVQELFADIESDPCLQLEFFSTLVTKLASNVAGQRLTQCLIEATQGLSFDSQAAQSDDDIIASFLAALNNRYRPFALMYPHILENAVVHQVLHHAWPESGDDWLPYYRELCTNFVMYRMMLLGQAVIHGRLTPETAIRTIQSLSRLSAHQADYPEKVRQACDESGMDSFQSLFGLIAGAFEDTQA